MTVHEKLDYLMKNASSGEMMYIDGIFSNTGTGSTSTITNCKKGDIVFVFEGENSTSISSYSGGSLIKEFRDLSNSNICAVIIKAISDDPISLTQNNASATWGWHIRAFIIRCGS